MRVYHAYRLMQNYISQINLGFQHCVSLTFGSVFIMQKIFNYYFRFWK